MRVNRKTSLIFWEVHVFTFLQLNENLSPCFSLYAKLSGYSFIFKQKDINGINYFPNKVFPKMSNYSHKATG